MTSKGLRLALFLSLFVPIEVDSINIFGGLTNVVGEVKCGLHKVGERIHNHEHNSDLCKGKQAGPNEIEYDKNYYNNYDNSQSNSPYLSTSRSTVTATATETSTATATSTLTSTSTSQSSSNPELGKRLINTGANCPDGYRADAAGNCYLAY